MLLRRKRVLQLQGGHTEPGGGKSTLSSPNPWSNGYLLVRCMCILQLWELDVESAESKSNRSEQIVICFAECAYYSPEDLSSNPEKLHRFS